MQLLLACAQPFRDAFPADRIPALIAEADWKRVLEAADRHGLLPLFHWHLLPVLASLPGFAREKLPARFTAAVRRNLWLTAELVGLLRLLEQNHIPAIPYKGPVLTASLYENIALREIADLDLLVRREDVLRAKELLLDQGYVPEFRLSAAQQAAYLASQCEYNLQSPERAYQVELHWDILPPHYPVTLDSRNWWDRQTTIPLLEARVPSLAPEDLLLVLCLHGAKHAWTPLRLVGDVAALLHKHATLDWDLVLSQARAAGAERMLLLGLGLAEDLLHSPLPLRIRNQLADQAVCSLIRRVVGSLFPLLQETGPVSVLLYRLHLWDSAPQRLRFLLRTAFTPSPTDLTKLQLPEPLLPLYGVVRVWGLLGAMVGWMWQRICRAVRRIL